MKDAILLYNKACIYEIVTLNYFLNFTNSETEFYSIDGKTITSMEGYSINIDHAVSDLKISDIRSIIIPGGDVSAIKKDFIYDLLREAKSKEKIIAAICAGVDVLDEAGILQDVRSTHSEDVDFIRDKHIITARANAYVDFAVETGKELHLFKDQTDLQETLDFWKYHKRMD